MPAHVCAFGSATVQLVAGPDAPHGHEISMVMVVEGTPLTGWVVSLSQPRQRPPSDSYTDSLSGLIVDGELRSWLSAGS